MTGNSSTAILAVAHGRDARATTAAHGSKALAWLRVLFLLCSLFPVTCSLVFAQAKTTIADTLYDQQGNTLSGKIVITNLMTFVSADGFTIPAGNQVTAIVALNGTFSVQLVPNVGANPAGTSYVANYYLATASGIQGFRTTETWVVPTTTPTNLLSVRALSPPLPTVMMAMSQINPPQPCASNQLPQWSGTSWQCVTGTGGGATFQANGTNTANQSTINFQSGTNIAVSNPSAGNVAFNFNGTLPIGSGGTGQTTAGAAFNALSPMTTLGDLIYGGTSGAGTRLAGNTSSTKQYLSQTGTGAASSAPTWAQIAYGDISGTPTLYYQTIQQGGTAQTQRPALNFINGSNATVSCVDNSGSARTDCTFAASSSAGARWDQLSNPTANLSLSMAADTSLFTFNAATGSGTDLFKWTDTANNTGTGALGHFTTASGSSALPWEADANGNGWKLSTAGLLLPVGTGAFAYGATTHGVLISEGASAAAATAATGNAGQVLISNGSGADPTFQDPIVSLAYVALFNTVSATATQTSSFVRIPNFSGYGTLSVTGSSITGSPSGCQITTAFETNLGTPASSTIQTFAFTPGNNYQAFVTGTTGNPSADLVSITYSCTTYPTGGTLNATYSPIQASAIVAALPTGSNVIGGVTQSGTWTVQPGNTANTTPWLASINQGGNTAVVKAGSTAVAAADPALAVSLSPNSPLPAGSNSIGAISNTGFNVNNTPTVVQGNAGSNAQAWWVRVGDATNGPAAVKAASTAAAATDPSLVTAFSPNSPLPAGSNLVGKAGFDNTTPGTTDAVSMLQPARTTGTITSATSVVGPVAVTGYGIVTVTINGTYNGVTAVFEFSDDGGTTWYAVLGTRTDSTVQETGPATLTNTTRAWDVSVYAATNFRVRATAWTSGTANIGITLSAAPIEAAPSVGLVAGTNVIGGVTQSGTWTVQPGNTANTTPWLFNVGQFGGTNVVTGTGASGAGIPRVTWSNDSDPAEGSTGSAVPTKGMLVGYRDSSGNLQAPVFCDKSALLNATASGNTQIVALAASKKVYFCSVVLMANAAVNVQITEGTGTNCATGTANLTAQYPLAANTGFSSFQGHPGLISVTAGDAICVNLSGALSSPGLAATVSYAQF